MKTPEWVKPALYGGVVGAAALALVGFTLGGWMTPKTARQMASDQAQFEVVAALAPICVQQSKQDPQMMAKLAQMKEARSYERSEMVMQAGWATMPGSTDPDRYVANACLETLSTQF